MWTCDKIEPTSRFINRGIIIIMNYVNNKLNHDYLDCETISRITDRSSLYKSVVESNKVIIKM